MSPLILSLLVAGPAPILINGETVQARMKHHAVAGCSIVIVQNFKVQSIQNFGVTSQGGKTPISNKTLFPAGQMSEPVAHVLAMRLVDQKRLTLDDPIRPLMSRLSPDPRLTVRHLLQSRGGFTMPKYEGYDATNTVPSLVEELKKAPTSTPPGEAWHRSPENISMLQILMEDATNQSMNQLLSGLFPKSRTRYMMFPPDQNYQSFAMGHQINGSPEPNGGRAYPQLAAMGLWTNGEEFGRFLGQMMACVQGNSKIPLSASTAKLIFSPIETTGGDGKPRFEEAMTFGSDVFDGRKIYLRGGATKGYYCQSWLNPSKGNAILIFTNRQLAFLFANEIRDSLLKDL